MTVIPVKGYRLTMPRTKRLGFIARRAVTGWLSITVLATACADSRGGAQLSGLRFPVDSSVVVDDVYDLKRVIFVYGNDSTAEIGDWAIEFWAATQKATAQHLKFSAQCDSTIGCIRFADPQAALPFRCLGLPANKVRRMIVGSCVTIDGRVAALFRFPPDASERYHLILVRAFGGADTVGAVVQHAPAERLGGIDLNDR